MWPFRRRAGARWRRVDERFFVSGPIRPEDMPAIAAAGFSLILCARPDGEEAGQPPFALLADAAARHGLAARHIPVRGGPTPEKADAFRALLNETEGHVLGFCRSGARARALHARAAEMAAKWP